MTEGFSDGHNGAVGAAPSVGEVEAQSAAPMQALFLPACASPGKLTPKGGLPASTETAQ